MKRFTAALIAMLLAGSAYAQVYPSKPIRLITTGAAGGPVDLLARAIAHKLQESWGQQVIVEAKVGAGGTIGIDFAAKQPADGYSLLVMPTGNAVINPHVQANLPYDTLKDFAPVTLLAIVENVLVVHPSVAAASVGELLSVARQKPGALSYASPGVGSAPHVAGALLGVLGGVKFLHVPYNSMAPAMNDVIGGQVSMMFLSMSSALKQVQAGKLRAIGIASLRRSPAAPELPTISEQGLKGFEAPSWYALMAPSGTPTAIVEKVAAETARALKDREVSERLNSLGAHPVGNTPAELAEMLRKESIRWESYVRQAGIRASN